jgi:hypothetical protein
LARELSMTVGELLEGVKRPLSNTEYEDWVMFFRLEAQEKKRAKRS